MTKQESTEYPLGVTRKRWIATLKNGIEIVTWAHSKDAARQKVWITRGEHATDIRPAGDPLTDRPKRSAK